MKRRHFLQAASTTLATLGLSQLDFLTQATHTHQALAQSGSRKLALLVGINGYTISPLNGCVTDIEMQYELLRHRYGFNPADILVLTDNTQTKPTRNNILAAFEEHLIKQAKPGDTVIFHYSGHGSLVFDPEPIATYLSSNGKGFDGTLCPMDIASDNRNDIMGKTLFLLSSQVNTDNFTMILDSCHSGGGTRGNHIIRTLPRISNVEPNANPSAAELNYQEQQMRKLDLSRAKLLELRTKGIAKGIAIGAAQANQYAIDKNFGDFSAGALSYLFTRYLWQLPGKEDINTTFDRLALITQELAGASGNTQEPVKHTAIGSALANAPVYNLIPPRPSAEGVIRSTNIPNQKALIEFWLGGVAETSLKGFAAGSLFTIIDDQGKAIGELEQTARSGLVGYGKLKSGKAPKPGTLLREKLRNLPSDITLTIGLHESLGDDRDAIAKALNAISQVTAIPVNQKSAVNFIVGRLTDEARTAGKTRSITISQPNDSIGLFTAGYDPIDSSLFGRLDEPVSQVADRLRPRLKQFLAREYLTRMVNGNASELKVEVLFKSQGNTQTLSNGGTRSLESSRPQPYKLSPNPKNPTRLDINLTNQEDNVIYTSAIQIANDGVMTILHPSDWNSPDAAAAIKPRTTQIIALEIIPPAGYSEILVITSASPLRDSLKGLQTIARGRGMTGRSATGYLSFDSASRSSDEPEDSLVGITRSLVSDLTRAVGLAGQSKLRGLNANQCAIYSQIIHTID
jgi:hypothetical protein